MMYLVDIKNAEAMKFPSLCTLFYYFVTTAPIYFQIVKNYKYKYHVRQRLTLQLPRLQVSFSKLLMTKNKYRVFAFPPKSRRYFILHGNLFTYESMGLIFHVCARSL